MNHRNDVERGCEKTINKKSAYNISSLTTRAFHTSLIFYIPCVASYPKQKIDERKP